VCTRRESGEDYLYDRALTHINHTCVHTHTHTHTHTLTHTCTYTDRQTDRQTHTHTHLARLSLYRAGLSNKQQRMTPVRRNCEEK